MVIICLKFQFRVQGLGNTKKQERWFMDMVTISFDSQFMVFRLDSLLRNLQNSDYGILQKPNLVFDLFGNLMGIQVAQYTKL